MIDDGSHRYLDQDATLHTLWPRVREGGFYVIEDVVVGALPWDAAHAKQVPRTPTPTLTLTLNLTLTLTTKPKPNTNPVALPGTLINPNPNPNPNPNLSP